MAYFFFFWTLATLSLLKVTSSNGSSPVPVLEFQDNIVKGEDTDITCTLPCRNCLDVDLSINANTTLKNCNANKGNNPNVTCTIEVTQQVQDMEFTCEAQFKTKSLPKKMIISIKPKIREIKVDPSDTVAEGTDVTLTCDAEGDPLPAYSWKTPDPQLTSSSNDLIISKANKSHEGGYQCTAVNKFGQDTRTRKLSVKVKPKIREIKPDPSDTVAEGTDVTLTCDAEGDPLPTYSWKTPNPQHNSNSSNLSISKAKKSHEGDYQCTVVNKFGQDTKTRKLSVKDPEPEPDGNRGDRPQSLIATILVTLIFLFFH